MGDVLGTGGWPSRPAATWRFCSLTAAITSPAVMLLAGQLVRVEPDAHAVVARAEECHVADALDAGKVVLDVEGRKVTEINLVVIVASVVPLERDEVDAHENARRLLLGRHAGALDLLGQLGLGDGDAVLHQHLRRVQVGAQLEGDVERHLAVVGAFGGHVEHALDAVDFLLDGRGDGVGDGLGVGARVGGCHLDGGRRHLGVLRHRQQEVSHDADDDDDDRQHRGENRPVDEDARKHERASCWTTVLAKVTGRATAVRPGS